MGFEQTGNITTHDAEILSEDGYRTLVSQVKDFAIYATDLEGRPVSWHEGVEVVLGYRRDEFLGSPVELAFLPEDIEAGVPWRELETARRDGVANDDRWMRRKDGTAFFATGRTAPLADSKGEIVGFSKVLRDDTERMLAEEQLRESERRYRTLLQNVRDYAIFALDSHGVVSEWTEGAQRLKRYSPEEVIGRRYSIFFTPEAIAAGEPERELEEARQNGRAEREGWRVRKGGERFWVNEIATAIYDQRGELQGFTKISRDLTEHKRLDEEREKLKKQLSSDLRAMTRLHKLSTRLVEVNELPEMLNEILDAIIVLQGADFGHILLYDEHSHLLLMTVQQGFPQDLAAQLQSPGAPEEPAASEALRKRERVIVEDVRVDPSYAPLLPIAERAGYRAVQSTPILGGEARVIGVLSTHFRHPHRPAERDLRLTDLYMRQAAELIERKRTEEQLRQSAAALRDADRRKDEFLATLAHELRNPLAPLRNGIQIMRLKGDLNAGPSRTVDMMDRQLQHLVRLVDDLLDVGRISSGKVILQRRMLDLREVLSRSVEAARPIVDAHGHLLEVDDIKRALPVNGDFDRLTQVFSNLLSNAAKYTERGGRIQVKVCKGDGIAVVRILDTGIGIPEEDLPHVFDLFSQVRVHQGRAEGGLGIGLSLVRSLITMHGGTVTADSAGSGKGSTFTVRLPLSEIKPQPSERRRVLGEASEAPRKRILVADDNADAAESLAMLLELEGHEVTVAHDGLEAVEKAREAQPELVFLDLGMPRMNGIEAAQHLRSLPEGGSIVIVALTGWGQAADRERTREAGFDHHMVKPVDVKHLGELLRAQD